METSAGIKKLEEIFGSPMALLGYQILMLSMTGQPCDVTFFKQKPAIDVTIDPQINLALTYGASSVALKDKLENIKLSNGQSVSISEIWTVNPMPEGGISEADLASVNLSEAEERSGPNGETLREMIRDTYHCESRQEEDRFLRRFIAS